MSYPPGTSIAGNTITLGSVPARIWLEVQVTGWPPVPGLKTVQAKVSATDPEQDGGGYSGANAMCAGVPANGADLVPAFQPCAANADCRASISGITTPCGFGEPSLCLSAAVLCSGGGTCVDSICVGGTNAGAACNVCSYGFQDKCDPQYIGLGNPVAGEPDLSSLNLRFGETTEPGNPLPDFHPSYLGTLVLDVPAGAKGSYTIDFVELETFMQDDTLGGSQDIPDIELHAAVVVVPCGRCCFGYDAEQVDCVDTVGASECDAIPGDQVFKADTTCPEVGGSDCPDCATNTNCDDGVACTIDQCGPSDGLCHNTPSNLRCDDGVFCNGAETCSATAGCIPGILPCSPAEICDESADECSTTIPAVSTWSLIALALVLAVLAKLRFRANPTVP